MVVNPEGWIITASHVVWPDDQQRRQVISYAVNRLFFQGDAGHSLGENADLFAQHRTGDPELDELLRRCYEELACRFDVEPTVTVLTATQIASRSPTEGLPAQVLHYTGFEKTDVAILRVDAANMPTVPLAVSIAALKSDQFVTTLGFPGSDQHPPSGATEPTKLLGRINIRSDSAGPFYETSAILSEGMSGGPTTDLAGQVVGLASSKTRDDASDLHHARLLPVDDIRSALDRANVEAVRGEIDQVFEQAMVYYWDHHYSAAIPLYRRVLHLHRGHPLAEWYLAQADAKASGPEDVPLPATAAKRLMSIIRLLVLAVGVIILLAVIRRYRPSMGIGSNPRHYLRTSVLLPQPEGRFRRWSRRRSRWRS